MVEQKGLPVPIDFTPPPDVAEFARRTAAFVRESVIPVEKRLRGVVHDSDESVRTELQQAARDAGVFCPQASREYGGARLNMRAKPPYSSRRATRC